MPKEIEPTVRRHFFIFTRDDERLEALYGDSLGKSKAVRHLIRRHLDAVEEAARRGASRVQVDPALIDGLED